MNKVSDFLKNHKYAIIWTVCYSAIMWATLKFLFNFDLFSAAYWRHLIHAELRGFAGFVFGILILAALPLYIATTAIIIRTKKPLITPPIPSGIKKIWAKMQPTLINPPSPEKTEDKKAEENSDSAPDALPDELPSELRTAYIRARTNTTPDQRSVFNQPIIQTTPEITIPEFNTPDSELNDIPLPTDFDIAPSDDTDFGMPDFTQMPIPTFSDITFDEASTHAPEPENPIIEHLNTIGKKFEIIDNIIITDKHAIATHNTPDFWVCDEEYWFATGKQIDSPIKLVSTIAAERGLTPILHLGTDNIMDIDTMCEKWESMGIKIIKSPTEIPE